MTHRRPCYLKSIIHYHKIYDAVKNDKLVTIEDEIYFSGDEEHIVLLRFECLADKTKFVRKYAVKRVLSVKSFASRLTPFGEVPFIPLNRVNPNLEL